MQKAIRFPSAVALLGCTDCLLMRFAGNAHACLLSSKEDPEKTLFLGVVRKIAPYVHIVPNADERSALGLAANTPLHSLEVLCRIKIPQQQPTKIHFDLSRLIFINLENGKGLEVRRQEFGMAKYIPK